MSNYVQKAENAIEQSLSQAVKREADAVWDAYRPKVEDAADKVAQRQVNRYAGWIVLLYVMVGIAAVFSVLGFLKAIQVESRAKR